MLQSIKKYHAAARIAIYVCTIASVISVKIVFYFYNLLQNVIIGIGCCILQKRKEIPMGVVKVGLREDRGEGVVLGLGLRVGWLISQGGVQWS